MPGYDYSRPGAYFVTLCAHEKARLFGDICRGEMHLSHIGEIVRAEWLRSAEIRPELGMGPFVIMPNHMHAIVSIRPTIENDELTRYLSLRAVGLGIEESHCRAQLPVALDANAGSHCRAQLPVLNTARAGRSRRSLGSFIAGFKAYSTKRINELRQTPRVRVWQPDYFESILRTEQAYLNAENYILSNPSNWENDKEYQLDPQRRI